MNLENNSDNQNKNKYKYKNFSIIVAASLNNNGIGINNTLPWKLSQDLKHFKDITTGNGNMKNAVIMGRKTYESIGKPLPNRINIIISNTLPASELPNVIIVSSIENALEYVTLQTEIENVFIIGGATVYNDAILRKECTKIFITYIDDIGIDNNIDIIYDTFFPTINPFFFELCLQGPIYTDPTNNISFSFFEYHRIFS